MVLHLVVFEILEGLVLTHNSSLPLLLSCMKKQMPLTVYDILLTGIIDNRLIKIVNYNYELNETDVLWRLARASIIKMI